MENTFKLKENPYINIISEYNIRSLFQEFKKFEDDNPDRKSLAYSQNEEIMFKELNKIYNIIKIENE